MGGNGLQEISALWDEHEKTLFPLGHTGKVHGCDLFSLSIEIGGSVVAFKEGQGKLGAYRAEVLQKNLALLEAVLPKLTDPNGQEYFGRLHSLGRKVLASLGR